MDPAELEELRPKIWPLLAELDECADDADIRHIRSALGDRRNRLVIAVSKAGEPGEFSSPAHDREFGLDSEGFYYYEALQPSLIPVIGVDEQSLTALPRLIRVGEVAMLNSAWLRHQVEKLLPGMKQKIVELIPGQD